MRDDRLVAEGQQLFRDGFCPRKEAGAESRNGENRLSDFHGIMGVSTAKSAFATVARRESL